MSSSERLRQKIALALPAFGATAWRIWDSPNVAVLYPEYLCTMHCIVRSSVPLMETAISRSLELAADDPVAAGVAAYLSDHVGEEMATTSGCCRTSRQPVATATSPCGGSRRRRSPRSSGRSTTGSATTIRLR